MVKISDNSGILTLRFFHFNAAQKNRYLAGCEIRCIGEARRGAQGTEMYHPEVHFLEDATTPLESSLTPIYPLTDGLSQNRIRQLINAALSQTTADALREFFPELSAQFSLHQALCYLHRPPEDADLKQLSEGCHPAQHRLILEELVAHQLSLLQTRTKLQAYVSRSIPQNMSADATLLAQLPFTPTTAQQRVCQEIFQDLARNYPMMRLLQGDVGSGKTLVAARAALQVIRAGGQVAIMAPTEILAAQHQKSFDTWFRPLNISTTLLTGRTKGKAREMLLTRIADNKTQLIVGTQALFQADVHYSQLALVIVDEQHRFGVEQRLALQRKGAAQTLQTANVHAANQRAEHPHQLVMTATPIPRTLAMSHYAHLDVSVIDQLPPGRTPIVTSVISQQKRNSVVQRIHQACLRGKQAYWVCTLVEESDQLALQAAEVTAQELQLAMPGITIGLVHGRLKAHEKDQVMDDFKTGNINLLVATTVIEVGVDVPNASLMVIDNPERLGLAQLHQLRGRVGRGSVESHCILLYESPLSAQAKKRLHAMREHTDGFKLADIDLTLRGPGELLGSRQSGDVRYRIVDLQRDAQWLPEAKRLPIREWPNSAKRSGVN